MNRRTWKHTESAVSRFFNSIRNPLSGRNSGVTASDSRHKTIFVEVKHSKRMAGIWKLYLQTKDLATIENKTPVLCLKENKRHGFLIVVMNSDFDELVKKYLESKIKKEKKNGEKSG